MRATTTLATLAATAAVIAGTATSAGAAVQDRTDAANDTTSPNGTPSAQVRDAADIRTLRGVHGDGRLRFTVTVADLVTPGPGSSSSTIVRLVTPTGRDYSAVLQFGEVGKFVFLTDNDAEQLVECEGLVGRAFAKSDRYVIAVPRSCVRNPREVRFGAGVQVSSDERDRARRTRSTGIIPISQTARDDARRDGTVGEEIRLGTRTLANN